jgi:translation initiation factor IF-1
MKREIEGVVAEALPRGMFAVECEDGRRILATVPVTARRALIKVIPGQRVRVRVFESEPNRGRIVGSA